MMLVGTPKEIKDSEYRVGLVPSTASELIAHGHRVVIERSAGIGAGWAMPIMKRLARKSFQLLTRSTRARS